MLLTMIKKGFAQQNKNSKNKSIVDKEKEKYERVPYVACECACENNTTLCLFWKNVQALM